MSSYINSAHVFLDVPATTVDEVFAFLSDKAVELGISDDRDAVLEAFKAREALGSTGMTGGFAIPHAKTDAVKAASLVAVKFTDTVEWASMDGEPIKAAIALFAPASDPTTYLGLLSKVAVMLMQEDFRETVKASSDAEEIAALINANLEDDEDEL